MDCGGKRLSFTHKVEIKNCTPAVRGVFGRVSTDLSHPNSAVAHDAGANARWALEELGAIELGDARNGRRMVRVFGQMLNSPGTSIPQCSAAVW
jgi:hypothetical protein